MTRLTGRSTVSWLDVDVETLRKDGPFTVLHLAVHTCGYGRQCARRESQFIDLDSVIDKYLRSVCNRILCG